MGGRKGLGNLPFPQEQPTSSFQIDTIALGETPIQRKPPARTVIQVELLAKPTVLEDAAMIDIDVLHILGGPLGTGSATGR